MRAAESVWAGFLSRIGWSHTYRRGHFVVHGDRPLLIRVTPAMSDAAFTAAAPDAARAAEAVGWTGDVLVVGATPFPAVRSYLRSDPPAGLLGEREGDRWRWDAGLWMRCDVCGRLGIYHEMSSWAARPCGHEEGPWHVWNDEVPAISQAWGQAAYAVSQRASLRTITRGTTPPSATPKGTPV